MSVFLAACWGLAGGLCVEGLELHNLIRHTPVWSWRAPIPQGLVAYLLSVAIRAGAGAVVAAAMTAGGQVTGAFAAFGYGVAAPLVIGKLSGAVPGAGGPDAIVVPDPPKLPSPQEQAEVGQGGGQDAR